MRILTILTGLLFIVSGLYLVANEGLTFLSVAFIVGLIFVVGGIIECLSYGSYRGDMEGKTWILVDGTTTFVLGVLVLSNRLSVDAVVLNVLALWVLVAGIRNMVRTIERWDTRDHVFFEHLVIGLINFLVGLYVFFDKEFFSLATLALIGICIVVQGLNIMMVGGTIVIQKPDFAKTKQEKLEEAVARAEEAHAAAKEAIRVAKEAKAEVKVVEATPEEQIDAVLAPRPELETAPGTQSLETESLEGKSRRDYL